MFLIEVISLLVKPFALTIRLFANMLAGHLVIASAIGLIFLFAKMQGGAVTSYLTAVPCLGLAIFIYIIEAFVTLLQAYLHVPEHQLRLSGDAPGSLSSTATSHSLP